MKKLLNYLLLAMSALAIAFACEKPKPEPEPEPEPVKPPKMVNAELTVPPTGGPGVYEIKVAQDWTTDSWTIAPAEDVDWISVSPKSGKGDREVDFQAEANTTSKARSVSFYVKAGEYDVVEIFISQAKQESNVNDSDLEFLKALVEGKMLGDATPVVNDWFNVPTGDFPGIAMEEKDGKFFITQFDGTPFTGFPEKMHLPELARIYQRGTAGLNGVRLPKDWDTPKLEYCNMSVCGLTGPIPDGLAASSKLNQLYLDQNKLFGALPHTWTSKVLEVVILCNVNNKSVKAELPQKTEDNAGLGYMVPASLDVVLNKDRQFQNDKTQMKLGGVFDGNYIGFEEGWGQERYERYDPNAKIGDKVTWSDYRFLRGAQYQTSSVNAEGNIEYATHEGQINVIANGAITGQAPRDNDLDVWAWYFSNMGYDIQFANPIPKVLLKWNQADANAYTAKCEAEYAK